MPDYTCEIARMLDRGNKTELNLTNENEIPVDRFAGSAQTWIARDLAQGESSRTKPVGDRFYFTSNRMILVACLRLSSSTTVNFIAYEPRRSDSGIVNW